MIRRDWFSFADRATVMAEYHAGPVDFDQIAPGIWGKWGNVICVGTRDDMRKVAAKMFRDRFHAGPCPMGDYSTAPALPCVFDRLMGEGRQ